MPDNDATSLSNPERSSKRKRMVDGGCSEQAVLKNGAHLLAELIEGEKQLESSSTWKRQVGATANNDTRRFQGPGAVLPGSAVVKRNRSSSKHDAPGAGASPPPPRPRMGANASAKEGANDAAFAKRLRSARQAGENRASLSPRNVHPNVAQSLLKGGIVGVGKLRGGVLQPILLEDPAGLVATDATTTTVSVRWDAPQSKELREHSAILRWAVECGQLKNDESLDAIAVQTKGVARSRKAPQATQGTSCIVPYASHEATLRGLEPSKSYAVRVRLEQWNGIAPVCTSKWTAVSCSTLEIAAEPAAPLRPVVNRVSSALAQLTILRAPCCIDSKKYACAEAYDIQMQVGQTCEHAGGTSNEDGPRAEWKTITSKVCTCTHPTTPEIIGKLEMVDIEIEHDKIYRFRASAMNSIDKSPWSEVSVLLPPPAAPSVRVEQVTSNRAHVVWNRPRCYGFEVAHYHVYVRPVGSDNDAKESVVLATRPDVEGLVKNADEAKKEGRTPSPPSASEETMSQAPQTMNFVAHNLLPNTRYEIHVCAKSDAGMGDLSESKVIETLPLPPPIPSNLSPNDMRPTELQLTWSIDSGAEVANEHGDAVSYEVCWRKAAVERSHACEWATVEVSSMACTLSGLAADTLYDVKVRGVNRGGHGAWSPVWTQRTPVHPPRRPVGFEVRDVTATAMTLSWDSAHDSVNFPVEIYQVCVAARLHSGALDPNEPWVAVASAAEDSLSPRLTKVVEDLEPGVTYCVQLRAVNSYGPGETTEELDVSTACDVPPPPSQPVAESKFQGIMLLTWTKPMYGSELIRRQGVEIEGYMVQMRTNTADWQTVHEGSDETRCIVKGVKHSTIYFFRVRGRNFLGWSEWSDEGMEVTPAPPAPPPPGSVVCVTTNNSATLQWVSRPEVTSYEVHQLVHTAEDGTVHEKGIWVSLLDARKSITEQLRSRAQPAPTPFDTMSREISSATTTSGSMSREPSSIFCMSRQASTNHGCSSKVDPASTATKEADSIMLVYTKDFLEEKTEYSFRVVAQHEGGQSFSPVIRAKTQEMDWARELSCAERGKLRDMCVGCEATGCFEILNKALHDVDTLSSLSYPQLAEIFEVLCIPPRQQERIYRAMCKPVPAPRAPIETEVLLESITISWEEVSDPLSRYPITGYVVRVTPSGCNSIKTQQAAPSREVHCADTRCSIPGLEPGTMYDFQVAAVNEPCGVGEWSPKLQVATQHTVFVETDELFEVVSKILNTAAYSAQVCTLLFQDEWTVDSLKSLKPEKLESMLRRLGIKEGAIRSLCLGLAPTAPSMSNAMEMK